MEKFSSFWSSVNPHSSPLPLIGFTDATDPRILQAANDIHRLDLARPVLIGNPAQIENAYKISNVSRPDHSFIAKELDTKDNAAHAELMSRRQKREQLAQSVLQAQYEDSLFQGLAMLISKKIDGLVGGSLRPTADIVKAAIQCVGTKEGHRLISGHFLIESSHLKTADDTPFLFADCAVMPEPSARSLAAIAIGAASSYRFFTGKEPRVALLSFSTRDSAVHPLVDRIKEAVGLIRKQEPQLCVDGEIQLDAALDKKVAEIKGASNSSLAGQSNVLVFPTLEAGNIGYKLVQRFTKCRIAGPLLWGLDKPMSDLSRGCTVEEVVDTTRCVVSLIRGKP